MWTSDQSRADHSMAWVVEDGIALAETDGQTRAAEYLAARGVPDTVIARVLCEPDKRRDPPWMH